MIQLAAFIMPNMEAKGWAVIVPGFVILQVSACILLLFNASRQQLSLGLHQGS